jgi:hypothetical protein
MRRTYVVLGLVACLAAGLSYAAVVPPSGPRTLKRFDAPRMADLELRMWQAYYAKERVRLFALLVTMLREQYHYSWAVAVREAFHLARAAATFGDIRANYDVVIPDLTEAYSTAAGWLHAGFDPGAVAHAELAWWVARRIPGRDSPEQVGALIADEYALLYEMPRELFVVAAEHRAEAGALRDAQAAQPDWDAIGRLLRESYAELAQALSTASA